MKLKIKVPGAQDADASHGTPPAPPSAAPTPNMAPSSVPVKLKLKNSVPPTPAAELPTSAPIPAASTSAEEVAKRRRAYTRKLGGARKRNADEDISPAAKRLASGGAAARRLSIKPPVALGNDARALASAGHKIKLAKRPSVHKRVTLTATRRPPPPRLPGHGYDSEDSEAETDPAIQQGFILRMQPSEDAHYLRQAIHDGKSGLPLSEGGADVSLRFLTSDYRRAVVKVRGRIYAAVLVDLPCVVESMKSWDKKGWWKVADICQMLLVLGTIKNEDEARTYPLPREVNPNSFEYAHGLTPPMHWVRKRRFRKRPTLRSRANVEEEVARLMKEDVECEALGGNTSTRDTTRAEWEQEQSQADRQQDGDEDEFEVDGEAIDTVEGHEQDDEAYEDEAVDGTDVDDADLEADLRAHFDLENADAPAIAPLVTASPIDMADQGASFAAVENSMVDDSAAETPAGDTHDPTSQDEQSSDEDYDDEEDPDSPDVMDEDAVARAAEKAQQLEEVADLEREIQNVRTKADNMTNQLLKSRELTKLVALEEDLRVKRDAFGLSAED